MGCRWTRVTFYPCKDQRTLCTNHKCRFLTISVSHNLARTGVGRTVWLLTSLAQAGKVASSDTQAQVSQLRFEPGLSTKGSQSQGDWELKGQPELQIKILSQNIQTNNRTVKLSLTLGSGVDSYFMHALLVHSKPRSSGKAYLPTPVGHDMQGW